MLSFDADEDMFTFDSARMSFSVTPDHTMWFKGKYQHAYSKVRVQDMSVWGCFDPLIGYSTEGVIEGDGDARFRFVGFFLGDGCGVSTNRVLFHLKKNRKKSYLLSLLGELGIPFSRSPSSTCEDAEVFYVETPSFLREFVDPMARSASKSFPLDRLPGLSRNEVVGLFDGLIASDGHASPVRSRLVFSTSSPGLAKLLMALAPHIGFDARVTHTTPAGNIVLSVNASSRTALESRAKYHGRARHVGKVFCATTSTGLLAVRGGPRRFAFVCGNTSPLEMVQIKLHAKVPIFVARQWVRHRTASLNELSARYSEVEDEFYLPDPTTIQPQSRDNKQGRAGDLSARSRDGVRWMMRAANEHAHDIYKALLGERDGTAFRAGEAIYGPYDKGDALFDDDFPGVARELARAVLPVGGYTEFVWSQNLHNMLHFLALRIDPHAQWEIRQYAEAVLQLIRPVAPVAIEAWEDYARHAMTFSRQEVKLLSKLLESSRLADEVAAAGGERELREAHGMTAREMREFRDKIGKALAT